MGVCASAQTWEPALPPSSVPHQNPKNTRTGSSGIHEPLQGGDTGEQLEVSSFSSITKFGAS